MVNIADIVDSIFPSDGSVGVVLTDTIRITFDREIDEEALRAAIIVEGQDTDEIIHNSYIPKILVPGEEGSLLESPGYAGLLDGTFEFKRISLTTEDEVSTEDPTGAGNLYRTKLLFSPKEPFKPDTTYKVYIAGDDDISDGNDFGVRSRSVFDVVADGGNTSTGAPVVKGTYDGSLSGDTINVRVTASGILGKAEFEWWVDSLPAELGGPAYTHINKVDFIKGTTISFTEGMYEVDDTWSVEVKRPEFYEGQVLFSFTTGGGNIQPVPNESATSPVGDPLPITAISSDLLAVTKTTPGDLTGNNKPESYRVIEIEFSEDIDPTSIDADNIIVTAEPVIEHPCLDIDSPGGEISKRVEISGNKLLIKI